MAKVQAMIGVDFIYDGTTYPGGGISGTAKVAAPFMEGGQLWMPQDTLYILKTVMVAKPKPLAVVTVFPYGVSASTPGACGRQYRVADYEEDEISWTLLLKGINQTR